MDGQSLSQKIFEAGVVGAGGAGFPTHVKLQASNIDTYLVNCAECEPLLTVDQHLMLAHTRRLVDTSRVVAEALGAARVVFGLKKKYTAQIEALRSCGAEVGEMGNFYPAGDEVIMIHDLLGRTVPEAGLPLMVGVVVNNPETLLCIADAMDGVPFTHTYVTVGGAVARRGVWRVPMGTPMSALLEAAGGAVIPAPAFIEGGPMTGRYSFSLEGQYVGKTTKGLLVVPSDSALVKYETMSVEKMLRQARVVCIQCSECSMVCSRGLLGYKLEPHKIMRMMAYAKTGTPEVAQGAFLCSECNICSGLHACPMGLSPRRVNQVLKTKMREAGIKPDFPRRTIQAPEVRKWRMLPSHRLAERVGLARYEGESPYMGDFPVQGTLIISTKQGAGVPVVPCVSAGDRIACRARLGTPPEGALGTTLHSPTDGYIEEVCSQYIAIRPGKDGE